MVKIQEGHFNSKAFYSKYTRALTYQNLCLNHERESLELLGVVNGAAENRARGIPVHGELVGRLVDACSAEDLAEVERVLRLEVDALVAKGQNVVLIRELRLDRR